MSLPIQVTLVLSVLIFNPDMLPKSSRVFKAAIMDSHEPFKMSVVLSAN